MKYICFKGKRHPKVTGKAEIERFLSHLAINRQVSASTQNQAYNAIVFLYKQVLDMPLEFEIRYARNRKLKPRRVQASKVTGFRLKTCRNDD